MMYITLSAIFLNEKDVDDIPEGNMFMFFFTYGVMTYQEFFETKSFVISVWTFLVTIILKKDLYVCFR